MRLAIAHPCFASSETTFRIRRSRVPWTRSWGLPIDTLTVDNTRSIVDCQDIMSIDITCPPPADEMAVATGGRIVQPASADHLSRSDADRVNHGNVGRADSRITSVD